MSRFSSIVLACVLLMSSLTAWGQIRTAFVTSARGTGDLSSWPEAEKGTSGLEAADSICQNLAADAGLDNPELFVAWISDSNDDAYCRIHGLNGKKMSNCGQPALPAAAGPWVRRDGLTFAASIEQMLSPNREIYTALRIDEHGSGPAIASRVWTATGSDGALRGTNTCSDWTDTPAGQRAFDGRVARTSDSWTDAGSQLCTNDLNHLFCLETEPGDALDLPENDGRVAFVTSSRGSGDLASWPEAEPGTTGIEAGDSICNNLADAAGLPDAGSYKAWLSDVTVDAVDRFNFDDTWVRPDGFIVAETRAELISGELATSIHVTESGEYIGNQNVWTGTSGDGTAHPDRCGEWGSEAGNGRHGIANAVSALWTAFISQSPLACTSSSRLYCLSDRSPEVYLMDGFEETPAR